MLKDDIKVGSICEIRPVEVTQEDLKKGASLIFSSSVLFVREDFTVDLAVPVYRQEPIELERNTRYSFLFIYKERMMTAHGVFLQRVRIDNVQMARIKLVTLPKKFQRRDYYRIGCEIPMHFQVLSMRADDFKYTDYMARIAECVTGNSWKSGTIQDISGGGMRFISETPIMDLPFIYATFNLGETESKKRVGLSGKILSRNPIPRSILCTYRVKFEPEHSRAQDDILAYVNSQQMVVAKKEQGR